MHSEDQLSDEQRERLFKSVVTVVSFEKVCRFLVSGPIALLALYFKSA